MIEGRVFDNYSPSSDSTRTIQQTIEGKVGSNQAHRITLDLSDSNVTRKEVLDQLEENPVNNLKEVIVIDKGGRISNFLPDPNRTP